MNFSTSNPIALFRLIRSDHSAFLHKTGNDLAKGVASELHQDTDISAKITSIDNGDFDLAKTVVHQAPPNISQNDQNAMLDAHKKLVEKLADEEEFADMLKQVGLY